MPEKRIFGNCTDGTIEEIDLTDSEQADRLQIRGEDQIKAVENERLEGVRVSGEDGIKNHVTLATATPDQAEAWIEANVNNIDTAKQALKHIVRFVVNQRNRDMPELEGGS